MTDEERKAFLNEKHIDVKGDYIDKQIVGIQINNVEPGGIAVQNNNIYQQKQPSQSDRAHRKTDTAKIRKGTYTYIYYDEEEGRRRLRILFEFLKEQKWLADDSGFKEWDELFSGQDKDGMLVWTGSQSQLRFLFQYMLESKVIVNKTGFRPFEILSSHFKKSDDSTFSKWGNFDEVAKRDENALRTMAAFLDIRKDITLDNSILASLVKTRLKSSESNINGYARTKKTKDDKVSELDFNFHIEKK